MAKKGHIITQCRKLKELKGKDKGTPGKGEKGQPKGGDRKGKGKGKAGPKGGCFKCGGDHYESDCPRAGKGQTGKAFCLSALRVATSSDEGSAPSSGQTKIVPNRANEESEVSPACSYTSRTSARRSQKYGMPSNPDKNPITLHNRYQELEVLKN